MQVEGSFIAVVARAFRTSAEDRFDQGAASLQFTVAAKLASRLRAQVMITRQE